MNSASHRKLIASLQLQQRIKRRVAEAHGRERMVLLASAVGAALTDLIHDIEHKGHTAPPSGPVKH